MGRYEFFSVSLSLSSSLPFYPLPLPILSSLSLPVLLPLTFSLFLSFILYIHLNSQSNLFFSLPTCKEFLVPCHLNCYVY